MQQSQIVSAATNADGDHRCPECGPIDGGKALRLPPTLRVALLVLALAIVIGPLVGGFESFQRSPTDYSEPTYRFVEPPMTAAELRRIAAGEQAPPNGFIESLLQHRPPLLLDPPGDEVLWVKWVEPSGWVEQRLEVGRPLRWLRVVRKTQYEDLFRRVPFVVSDDTRVDAPGVVRRGWQRETLAVPPPTTSWSGGSLIRRSGDGSRTTIVNTDALALVLLLPIAAVALVALWQRCIRRRKERSTITGWRRRGMTLALVLIALAMWNLLDVERTSGYTHGSALFTMAGHRAGPIERPSRTALTAEQLRELQKQPAGAFEAAAAIADLTPEALGWMVLTVGYRQHSIPQHTGWRCGWPLRLLTVETVQRHTGPRAAPGMWGAHPSLFRMIDNRLVIVIGARRPTDRLLVMQVYIGRLAVLVIGAFVVWSMARWLCLAPLRLRRWRRDRTGRCMRCGYVLRRPEAAIT